MVDLTNLTAQVKANTDVEALPVAQFPLDALRFLFTPHLVEASAIVLLNGLSAQIASLKNDPVALQALADQLKTSSSALADAITANTPAA